MREWRGEGVEWRDERVARLGEVVRGLMKSKGEELMGEGGVRWGEEGCNGVRESLIRTAIGWADRTLVTMPVFRWHQHPYSCLDS